MEKQTIKTYNQLAQEYDDETSDFWERFPVQILDEFAQRVTGKVLDVGSGPGRDALLLKQSGLEVICLDASEAMVEITKQKGLESVEADLLHLPFPAEIFEGVWSYTALLHIKKKDFATALSEIHRVLKKNGTFGLGMIEGDKEEYTYSSGMDLPRWFAFYHREEIEQHLQKAGFRILFYLDFQPGRRKYLNFICQKI